MAGNTLSAERDWTTLRRRFAGEALVQALAFSGYPAHFCRRNGARGGLFLTTEQGCTALNVGPVALLWQGKPLDAPPDWPREIDPDAARFFLTSHPLTTAVALDLDLAARRDNSDPYYFICYTQKRLCALLSRPEPEGLAAPGSCVPEGGGSQQCLVSECPAAPALWTPEGRALALAVGRFPAAVRRAAEGMDPYPVNRFASDLAKTARCFLRAGPCRKSRPLLRAASIALGNALRILNLSI